ncbi:hypothetical protein CXB51_001162 [Gossypium anomalum]|uniref:Disease resistance protein winged helix domain-containing protein n=1 Tax=Gossypium anomalum TaxID=47600 RepID=A0A8J6A1Y8_9ROSI|nr:hypothetical protein CXB51_001162 [Gossypium anomalum]
MEELGKKALFHQQRGEGNGGEMMEDVAEGCLVELVEMCMVQVGERWPTLKIKTYRMHDLMRGLCLSVAKKENFFCIIDDLHPLVAQFAELLHINPLFFKALEVPGCWTYLFNNFKLLRVLECEGCENVAGCKLPNAIAYSGFCCVPDVIWKLEQLGHLYLPEKMSDKTKSKFTKLRKLEIFGSLHIEDCKEGLDKNLPIITSKYLQSLSIDGGGIDPKLLAHLLSSCVYLCELILDGKMRMLPDYHRFPSRRAYICLRRFKLGEDIPC